VVLMLIESARLLSTYRDSRTLSVCLAKMSEEHHGHSHGPPQGQTINLPPGAPYTPPSSVDSLLNLHTLSISGPNNEISLDKPTSSSTLTEALALINRLVADLTRSKLENTPPPPPQPVPGNIRSNLVNRAKDEGNGFFKTKDYATALQKYNIALQFASTRPLIEASLFAREELSVVLSNRSATYMALGMYVEALCDAEAIVELKKGWPKGHFRKGRALLALGELEQARDAFIFGLDFEPGEKV